MKLLTLSLIALISVSSVSANELETYRFGNPGRDGRHGSHGSDGQSGQDVTIRPEGTFRSYDLRGRRGQDASDGERGDSASSCYQPRDVRHDLYGAEGGRGGDAGKGGDGGAGGDTLIFFKNEADLKSIQIFNDGAPGGRSGSAGYGSSGCDCTYRNWTAHVCRDVRVCDPNGDNCHNERRCHDEHYSCRDGVNGSPGRGYSDGTHGSRGSVVLVKGLAALPAEQPGLRTELTQLAGKTVELSRRIFDSKNGARALLADGSSVSDSFALFNRLATKKIKLVWGVNRPVTDFKGVDISAVFDGNSIQTSIGSGILFKSKLDTSTDLDVLTITDAFLPSELDRLSLLAPEGNLQNLTLIIKDDAGLSRQVKTKVHLMLIYKRWVLGKKIAYMDDVPEQALEISDGAVKIAIAKLPGVVIEKLKAKRKITASLMITREYGGRTVMKDLEIVKFKLK